MNDNKELQTPAIKIETRIDRSVQQADRDIITAAINRAPSGNNAKPFIATWNDQILNLRHSVENSEHYLNRGNSATLLAFGCTLASIQIAANAQGFMAQFNLPNFENPNWSMNIQFAVLSQPALQDLARVIPQRQTYRNAFQSSQVEPELRAELEGMKFENAGVEVATADELTQDFKNYIINTENNIWAHARATQDFLKGVRFNQDSQAENRGISTQNLGSDLFQIFFLKVFSFFPSLPSIMTKLPILKNIFTKNARRDVKNSHFMVIHAGNLEARSILNAGYLAMTSWLILQQRGFRVQPMSSSSLCLVDAAKGLLPLDTTPEFLRLFNTVGPRVVDRQFQLTPPEQCVWILRFGKA